MLDCLANAWNMNSQDELEYRTKFLDCITEEGEEILPILELWANRRIQKC